MQTSNKIVIYSLFLSLPLFSILNTQAYAFEQSLDMPNQMPSSSQNCPVKGKTLPRCTAYHQTTNYTCGPAAVMTVMHYYGKLRSPNYNQKNRTGNC